MKRLLLVTCAALPLLLGCGDDDEETTTTTTAETETQVSTAPAGGEPAGELSERGIGAIEVGATTDQVEAAFGAPDDQRELPGCELAGPNATPILQWTWTLEDGSLSLDFEAASRELVSYRTTSTELPTTTGVRVGDSFQTLRDSYGAALKALDLGAASTERAGFWYVGKPAKRWLLFTIAGGNAKTIQGGDIQICE